MIISEERTKHAMKQYPAFFNRGMRQIGYGAKYIILIVFKLVGMIYGVIMKC